jgi:hypothetical protein
VLREGRRGVWELQGVSNKLWQPSGLTSNTGKPAGGGGVCARLSDVVVTMYTGLENLICFSQLLIVRKEGRG